MVEEPANRFTKACVFDAIRTVLVKEELVELRHYSMQSVVGSCKGQERSYVKYAW